MKKADIKTTQMKKYFTILIVLFLACNSNKKDNNKHKIVENDNFYISIENFGGYPNFSSKYIINNLHKNYEDSAYLLKKLKKPYTIYCILEQANNKTRKFDTFYTNISKVDCKILYALSTSIIKSVTYDNHDTINKLKTIFTDDTNIEIEVVYSNIESKTIFYGINNSPIPKNKMDSLYKVIKYVTAKLKPL